MVEEAYNAHCAACQVATGLSPPSSGGASSAAQPVRGAPPSSGGAAGPPPPAFAQYYEYKDDKRLIYALMRPGSQVPIALRRAYAPRDSWDAQEIAREMMLYSVVDGLRHSRLWEMLHSYAVGECSSDRKIVSHFGAVPCSGQPVPRHDRNFSLYYDEGNARYSRCFEVILFCGRAMGLTPPIQTFFGTERKADCIEACLGTYCFVDHERFGHNAAWQLEEFRLEYAEPGENVAIRLMIIVAYVVDLLKRHNPTRLAELLPENPEALIVAANARSDALERGGVDRVRSIQGEQRNYSRSSTRYFERKGKGLPLGKVKGKGKGNDKGGAKGKDKGGAKGKD